MTTTISEVMIDEIIETALREDIGDGDHSTLSCVPQDGIGTARLIVKDNGIIAGVELAQMIFKKFDPSLEVEVFIKDGEEVKYGDIAYIVKGPSRSILTTERLVLNFMQRMSGIASQTNEIVKLIEGTEVKLLDTRKTTPGIRYMEKWAVRIGGGHNHRFALYDMIMLKDNHVDYAGGIKPAIENANAYLKSTSKDLRIEIEVRNEEELAEVLEVGNVDRIMLDNFSPERIVNSLKTIPSNYEVEASGGITLDTIRSYAETGVHFISVGALTHSFQSLDMSLKAVYE
ncbi:MAG: carboxylating nicotinate-nucleotide diphosphorylase [Crocinitomicaceae bacterium]|nr:carboxylating nicotinate-nucleotide diphosphorylase [Crocinitomicaceae bacterium]MDG1657708.1 carboxylating nicotinate-nucleotide diphosphorylase [Crocinitomicaceae bacterium]|tara:strand:- start:5619 stop:6479 length:861 start_codon:yes stop_codon:yes gene_type:complete